MEKKNPIDEARRYVANAKTLLREHGELDPDTQCYGDPKYVRMAGDTLWKGCLIALDAAFGIRKNLKKGQRPDIDDYKSAVAARDKKLLQFVNSGYTIMHLHMGYDGVLAKGATDTGFRLANEIINRCSVLYNPSSK